MSKQSSKKHSTAGINSKQSTAIKKDQNNKKLVYFILGAVLLTTLIVYFKVLDFSFINSWDDTEYIIENQYIQSISVDNLIKLCTGFFVANYQPVTMLLYSFAYYLGSESPGFFHGLNIIIHLINSYLVFVLIRKILPDNSIKALITAAFFAIHPMHIESVAWVSELKDVLYSFFFLLGLIQYCRFIINKQSKLLVFTFFLFVLSCLSKSAAVVFPLIMLLVDYYFNGKLNLKLIIEKIPFFIVSLVIGLVAVRSQQGSIQEMAPVMTTIEHISIVSFSFLSYLFKLVVPVHLAALYPYPTEIGHSPLPFYYYLSFPVVLGIVLFVWYSRRWGRTIIFGFMFFVITIILVLQLVPVGAASMADRYSYIPYIGLIFILAKGFESILSADKLRAYKKFFLFILVVFFAGFTVIANERTKDWENNNVLFTDNIEKYPDSSTAYFNRASGKDDMNDLQGALIDYNNAIELQHDYLRAYTNRAVVKCKLNDFAGALSDFNFVIKRTKNDIKAYYNRGLIFNTINRFSEAIPDFDRAIRLNPLYAEAYNNRAVAYFNLMNYQQALNDWNKAIELNPDFSLAIQNRKVVLNILNNQGVN